MEAMAESARSAATGQVERREISSSARSAISSDVGMVPEGLVIVSGGQVLALDFGDELRTASVQAMGDGEQGTRAAQKPGRSRFTPDPAWHRPICALP